jgi:hypothetical protein
MRKLLHDPTFSDVTLVLEEGKYQIPAHKCVLSNRCEFFKRMLTSQMRESRENKIVISDTKYEVFINILNFIYTDEILLTDVDTVVNLLIEANKYNLL